MTRRAAPFLALLLLAASACERHPVAPSPAPTQFGLPSHENGNGPPYGPDAHSFGPDTYTTEGPYTGTGIVTPGLACTGSQTALSCSGYLPSAVDGTMLDVLLMIPNASGPFPLVVIMHGWGGSKNGEGDLARTLIADGYAVLRYSARGFGDSWGRVNLADMNVERRDLKSLVAQVVDHPGYRINPDAIAVTGASYGGAHSWFALVEPTFTTPRGNTVRVRTVVPIAAWSDLVASLIPNGHRSSLEVRGALKFSYVQALYFSGQREPPDGPEPWYDNYPDYLRAWHGALTTFEPTLNPIYTQIQDGLGGGRSIWWQQSFWRSVAANPVPVFQLHGFTDDLFTLDEPKRMLLALKTINPAYPIASYFGDIGHPRARNKPGEVDYAIGLIRTWLAYYLKGVGTEPAHDIIAAITRPGNEAFDPVGNVITVPSYDQLAAGSIDTTFSASAVLVNPASGALNGAFRDPVLEAGISGAGELAEFVGNAPKPDPTVVAYEVSVDAFHRGTFLIAGQPTISLNASTAQSRVQFNVRLFDIAPGGQAHLVTRGTYTLDTGTPSPLPVSHQITISTQGNLWRAEAGHVLRLEVVNADFPYIAPSQLPSMTEISNVKLTLPVR